MSDRGSMFSHGEFEELLKKDIENLLLTKEQLPLTSDEFASALAGVIAHAMGDPTGEKVMSVALESGRNSTWLPLPATAQELHRALLDMDALDKQYAIVDCRTRASLPLRDLVCGGDINEVNYLAARLAELPPTELEKLEAVMESTARYESIAQMIDYTYNVDSFVLMPGINNAEELARYYVEIDLIEKSPGVDMSTMGARIEATEDGKYTPKGYLLPSGDEWQRVYESRRVVPAEYRIENYLKSAEMSVEQNYNMLDGIINNTGPRRADLTDGQTHEEIVELAPETLENMGSSGDKPSILSQLHGTKENEVQPRREHERPPNHIDR